MSVRLQPGVPEDHNEYKRWESTEDLNPSEKKIHEVVDYTLNELLIDVRRVTVSKKSSFFKEARKNIFKGFSKIKEIIGFGPKELLPPKSKEKLLGLVKAKGNFDLAFSNLTEFSETRFQTNVHKLMKELDAAQAKLTQDARPLITELNKNGIEEPDSIRLTLSSYQNEYASKAEECSNEDDFIKLHKFYEKQLKSADPLERGKAKYILTFSDVYEKQKRFDKENELYQNAPQVKKKALEEFQKAQRNLQDARDAVLKDSDIKRVCKDPEDFYKLLNDSELAQNSVKLLKPILEQMPDFKKDLEKEKAQEGGMANLFGNKFKKMEEKDQVEAKVVEEIPLKNLRLNELQDNLSTLEKQFALCNVSERKQLISLGMQIADVKLVILEKVRDFAIQVAERNHERPKLSVVAHYFTQAQILNDLKQAFQRGDMKEIIKYRSEVIESLKGEKKAPTPREYYTEIFGVQLPPEEVEKSVLDELEALIEKRLEISATTAPPKINPIDKSLEQIEEIELHQQFIQNGANFIGNTDASESLKIWQNLNTQYQAILRIQKQDGAIDEEEFQKKIHWLNESQAAIAKNEEGSIARIKDELKSNLFASRDRLEKLVKEIQAFKQALANPVSSPAASVTPVGEPPAQAVEENLTEADLEQMAPIKEAAKKVLVQEELERKKAQNERLAALKIVAAQEGYRELITNFQRAFTEFRESQDLDQMKTLLPQVYASGKKLFDAQKKAGVIPPGKYSENLSVIMTNINVKDIKADSPLIKGVKEKLLLVTGELEQHLKELEALPQPEKHIEEIREVSVSENLMNVTVRTEDELLKEAAKDEVKDLSDQPRSKSDDLLKQMPKTDSQ